MEHKPKVLVVDDDESIRELIQVYLEDDFQVLHAASGIEAVEVTKSEKPLLMIRDLIIDLKKHKVILKEQEVDLTTKEFQLLVFLSKNEGQVISRELLLQRVWGFDFEGDSRAVDSAIKRLRKKLENIDKKVEFIHSVRSIGYKFEVRENENYI